MAKVDMFGTEELLFNVQSQRRYVIDIGRVKSNPPALPNECSFGFLKLAENFLPHDLLEKARKKVPTKQPNRLEKSYIGAGQMGSYGNGVGRM